VDHYRLIVPGDAQVSPWDAAETAQNRGYWQGWRESALSARDESR
jgi:hypothetical protein